MANSHREIGEPWQMMLLLPGLQFYFLVAATVSVLVLGIERLVLASVLVAMGAGLVTALQLLVPADTAVQPHWALTTDFMVSTISACVMTRAPAPDGRRPARRRRCP
jgi:hypothetical protein